MTAKREHLDYLSDIQEAVSSILAFTEGMTWEQFASDQKTLLCGGAGLRDDR